MAKRGAVLPASASPESSPTPEHSDGDEEVARSGASSEGDTNSSGSEVADDSASSQSDPSSAPSQEIVNVDVEFFDPKPSDFHGIKTLLRMYLDDEIWDISGFVDLVLAQTTVGSVIKTEDDEDPIGLVSVLNLARYKESLCMLQLHKFLSNKCSEKPEATKLDELWSKHAKEVGLLVSERLLNLPLELAPPLYTGLFDEISWATEDEPSEILRDSFKFKHYLLLTRVSEELNKEDDTSKSHYQKKRQKQELRRGGNLIYLKPEDEIFHQRSSWSFTFPLHAESMAAQQTKSTRRMRLVMAIEAKHIHSFKSQLKALVENT